MHKSLPIAVALVVATSLAACGGSDSDSDNAAPAATPPAATQPATTASTTTTTATDAVASRDLTIKMSEFAFDPKDSQAQAGKVTISAPNDGKVVHELVVLKTDADPAALPKKGGKVDESTSVGEIADVEPGTTKKHTFKLTAGKYAIVCALPGHYEGGMYGSITVR